MARNSLICADVPLRNYSLTHPHLLKQLHWLPIDWRIRFKLSTLTFKALHTGRPKYLTDLLHLRKPTRSVRSPYTQLLTFCFRSAYPSSYSYLSPMRPDSPRDFSAI